MSSLRLGRLSREAEGALASSEIYKVRGPRQVLEDEDPGRTHLLNLIPSLSAPERHV